MMGTSSSGFSGSESLWLVRKGTEAIVNTSLSLRLKKEVGLHGCARYSAQRGLFRRRNK